MPLLQVYFAVYFKIKKHPTSSGCFLFVKKGIICVYLRKTLKLLAFFLRMLLLIAQGQRLSLRWE